MSCMVRIIVVRAFRTIISKIPNQHDYRLATVFSDLKFNPETRRWKACLSDNKVSFFDHLTIPDITKRSLLYSWLKR